MDFWGSNEVIGLNLLGLTTVIGSIISLYFFVKATKGYNWDKKDIALGVIIFFSGAILGTFIHQLLLPMINIGVTGGLLGGLTALVFFLNKKSLSIWGVLDISAPYFVLAYGISRIGYGVFGHPTSRDPLWAIRVDGFYVHPTQAYEFILCFLLFGYLLLRAKSHTYKGQAFFHAIIGLLLFSGLVDFFRDTNNIIGSLSLNQIISFAFVIIVVVTMKFFQRNTAIVIPANVEKYDIAKVWFYIWSLTLISIISYYLLQG